MSRFRRRHKQSGICHVVHNMLQVRNSKNTNFVNRSFDLDWLAFCTRSFPCAILAALSRERVRELSQGLLLPLRQVSRSEIARSSGRRSIPNRRSRRRVGKRRQSLPKRKKGRSRIGKLVRRLAARLPSRPAERETLLGHVSLEVQNTIQIESHIPFDAFPSLETSLGINCTRHRSSSKRRTVRSQVAARSPSP